MSLEDPFFVVKDEVTNALTKARNLFQRWQDLQDDSSCSSKEELEWTTTELKNGIRSVEWDLEDLEETIGIVENNPKKFKIDESEISSRRKFITQSKTEVKSMRDKLLENKSNKETQKMMLRGSVGINSMLGNSSSEAKYTRLENNFDSPYRDTTINVEEGQQQQQLIYSQQDDTMEKIRQSIGTLKSISRQIGTEVDEQAVMLDDLGNEIEVTDTRLDTTLKKVAKVLHLSNDRRQWVAIGVLAFIMLIIVALLLT